MQVNKQGFTLIEVLIVSPIIILMLATFIGLAVITTGDALRNGERNSMTFAIQSSLDVIEDDVYRALSFPVSNSGFIVNSARNTLIIKTAATTTNPQSSSRNLVYIVPTANASPCPTTNLEAYSYQSAYYIYYVKSGGLWKRTIVNQLPSSYTTCPSPAWQKTSCFDGESNCTSATAPKDVKLLDNVSAVNFSFYSSPKSSTPRSCSYWTDSTTPSTIGATITTSNNVAGETISKTESIRASSINVKNISEACIIP